MTTARPRLLHPRRHRAAAAVRDDADDGRRATVQAGRRDPVRVAGDDRLLAEEAGAEADDRDLVDPKGTVIRTYKGGGAERAERQAPRRPTREARPRRPPMRRSRASEPQEEDAAAEAAAAVDEGGAESLRVGSRIRAGPVVSRHGALGRVRERPDGAGRRTIRCGSRSTARRNRSRSR